MTVDEWAAARTRSETQPGRVPAPGCGSLMALLRQSPNPFVEELAHKVELVAASPWGVQLAASFSRDRALATYARLMKRYEPVIGERDPSLSSTLLRSRGTRALYQVRIGAETRRDADQLCGQVRRAGGACMVLRNSRA